MDLQHPEGLKIIHELAKRADVVLENFVPGVAERLGLGYAALSASNPAVVYASVSGYGQDGPYARRPGYNTIAMGMSGLMALTGQPGDPPTRPGGSISDVAASYIAFGAVCAALVQRFRTGRGQHVDVSLLASSVALLPDPSAHYFSSGVAPKRVGNRNPNVTPAEAFQASDGFINVVILNPDQYEKFCKALGDEGLITEPRFATNEARVANHPDFKARIEAALAQAHGQRVGRAHDRRRHRGGTDLRVRPGVRGRAGPPHGHGSRGRAAGPRHRPHAGLSVRGRRRAAVRSPPRSAAGRAHARGAGRARHFGQRDRRAWPRSAQSQPQH